MYGRYDDYDEEQEELNQKLKLRAVHQSRLWRLQQQVAQMGISIDPRIPNEAKGIEAQINQINAEIGQPERSEEEFQQITTLMILHQNRLATLQNQLTTLRDEQNQPEMLWKYIETEAREIQQTIQQLQQQIDSYWNQE